MIAVVVLGIYIELASIFWLLYSSVVDLLVTIVKHSVGRLRCEFPRELISL